jgi:hypothetical protein
VELWTRTKADGGVRSSGGRRTAKDPRSAQGPACPADAECLIAGGPPSVVRHRGGRPDRSRRGPDCRGGCTVSWRRSAARMTTEAGRRSSCPPSAGCTERSAFAPSTRTDCHGPAPKPRRRRLGRGERWTVGPQTPSENSSQAGQLALPDHGGQQTARAAAHRTRARRRRREAEASPRHGAARAGRAFQVTGCRSDPGCHSRWRCPSRCRRPTPPIA